MKKRMLILGIIVIVILAIGFKLASNKKKLDEKKKPVVENKIAIPVNTVTVALQDMDNPLIKTGSLIPYKEADIMAASAGKLVSVNFELGAYVSRGQVVATVDNRGLQLNLEAAQLAKAKAEKDFKRYKTLLEGEATTEVNFQDAKLANENADNKIDLIQKQISDNRIKAPVSGRIVSKLVEAGEYVNPGTVLGHIVDVDRLKVEVYVSEGDAYTLKTGKEVKVSTDIYPGVIFNGKVSFVSSKGDATHNYEVEVELNNRKDHQLKAGTFAYVDFERKSLDSLLLIPRSALLKSVQTPLVYVIDDGKAEERNIKIGRDFGDQVEVVGGLKTGDVVITSGQVNLKSGSNVRSIAGQK
jgi:RND family efflux transporter MFP subunit